MAGKPNHRGWGHVREERSGNWSASYIGPDGHRHRAPMTYAKRVDAEGWLHDERKALELDSRGIVPWTPPGERTRDRWVRGESLADYGDRWIAERPVKATTRDLYERQFDLHVVPVLGELPVRAVTPEAVRGWFAGLGTDSPRRNSQVYGLLHSILATAVEDGVLAVQPCQIKGAMNTQRKRQPVILTVEELEKVVAAEVMPDRYRALVLVAAWCGLRWGEVTELRRADLSADCSVITVSRGVTHKGECRVDTPKSGVGRKVIVPPHVRPALKQHLAIHTGPEPDALLFTPQRGGCHVNDKVFAESYFRPAVEAAGRTGVRIHDLRHFAGTMTARVANLAETQARLGHATVKAAMLYQGQVSGRDGEVADALSKMARKGTRKGRKA